MKHVPYSSNEKKNIFQKLVRTLVNQLTTGPLIYNSKMDLLEKSPPPHDIAICPSSTAHPHFANTNAMPEIRRLKPLTCPGPDLASKTAVTAVP